MVKGNAVGYGSKSVAEDSARYQTSPSILPDTRLSRLRDKIYHLVVGTNELLSARQDNVTRVLGSYPGRSLANNQGDVPDSNAILCKIEEYVSNLEANIIDLQESDEHLFSHI